MIKTFLFLVVASLSLSATADLVSPFRSTVDGVTIPNAHLVVINPQGKSIYRGNSPLSAEHVEELVLLGVERVIVFKNFYTVEDRELVMDLYRDNGIPQGQISHIEMPWKNIITRQDKIRACRFTLRALAEMRDSTTHLFFHCTVGEDRTGILAGLARIAFNNWSPRQAFDQEMCPRGYEAGNPNKATEAPNVVKAIRESLTPLYLQLATIVKKGQWSESSCYQLPDINSDQIVDNLRTYDLTCQPAESGLSEE